MESVYLTAVLSQYPRLYSKLDREEISKTYGCFDRTFWSWKFVDFPGARFQENVYSLAWLYNRADLRSPVQANVGTLSTILSCMKYWASCQRSDGSFDEAYPFEHSLAATAFTAFYIGETYLLVSDKIPELEASILRDTLDRAASWLCKNKEHHGFLTNHLAAAAAALDVIYRITGRQKYIDRSNWFINLILEHQSTEGWYDEYGGADIGYQTHGTFYLARVWQRTKDNALLHSLQNANEFLSHFIHPNKTLGGEYGSRNTSFYFPAAYEILADQCPRAASIASFMRESIDKQIAPGVVAMDSYNLAPMLNNYLFAHDALTHNSVSQSFDLPFEIEGAKSFDHCGLHTYSTKNYYAIVSSSKGGVLKVFSKQGSNKVWSDSGYWAATHLDKRISNQGLNLSNFTTFAGNTIACESKFSFANQMVMNPWLFLGFRLFMLTLGRSAYFARGVKNIMVSILVKRKKTCKSAVHRKIRFSTTEIDIYDKITVEESDNIVRLKRDDNFSVIHMGSSRYFQKEEHGIGGHSDINLDSHHIIEHRRISV